ncbi:putative histone acetyltransferase [Medicago truncatula]|nr:putative histone acetyltransferase [Medicago truncatula]
MQRHQQPITEMQKGKITDLSKRLDEGLFKAALTKDDYMNLDTLESRLSNFLRQATMHGSSKAHKTKVLPLSTKAPKDIPATTFSTSDHVEPPPKQTLIRQVIVALPSRSPILTESNRLRDEAVDVSQNAIEVDVENVQSPVKNE